MNEMIDLPFEQRGMQALKEHEEIEKKCGVKFGAEFNFPMYNQLPPDILLALEVLKKHNPVFKITVADAKGQ